MVFVNKPSMCYHFDMSSREQLLQEVETKIEDTTERLRSYFHDLGEAVYLNQEILPVQMGVKLLEETRNNEKASKEAKEKVKELELFIAEYDDKKGKKSLLDTEKESLRLEEKNVRMRLGALIYEQCSLGILDRTKFGSVYEDADNEKSLSEKKSQAKGFWERFTSHSQLSRMKRNDESRYMDYSSLADNQETASLITGEKGEALTKRLFEIKAERDEITAESSDLEVFLEENNYKRRELERGGMEKARSSSEELSNTFRECLINYGNYLYDRGATWIGEGTPSAVLDVLQMIIEAQNEYASLQNRRAQLQREAKADDYRAMIDDERAKIRILENEREKIGLQIEEIQREIERLEGMVEKLTK